uniref:Phosphoprotein phosphatase n=1 Tax=Byssovorax cruenta TaxID=293647 RepID=A0A3S5GXY0_9BACT|nr:phosphoprotein phosphatase [Byssovorax cruenta]
MRAVAAGLSDIGKQRIHNEDRFILLPEFNVFAVADGMGGHQAGEVASRMAANAIAMYFRKGARERSVSDKLRAAVSHANTRIFARSDDSRKHRGMGTTIVAVAYDPSLAELFIAHAGDSRCYRVRDGRMRQLTRDHSLVADALLHHPDLSERDLAYLPRNVITRALGVGPSVDLDFRTEHVELGDVYLLCSDGLHGLVSDEAIAAIIKGHESLSDACAALIKEANDKGGRDNITAVLVRIEDGEEPWSTRTPQSTG